MRKSFHIWIIAVIAIASLVYYVVTDSAERAKADACLQAGYVPVYAPRSRTVQYCARTTTDGPTETINPEDLP